MIAFFFDVLFWMFFEQAGSSFSFLAKEIVDRDLGGWVFPTAWFQSVNSIAIIMLAPIIAWIWVWMARRNANPSIPRKFGLGLIFNGAAFALLMFALSSLVASGLRSRAVDRNHLCRRRSRSSMDRHSRHRAVNTPPLAACLQG